MSKVKTMIAATLALGTAVLALGATEAFADKLSDFKEADRYDEGCRTIPVTYSSDRDACDREGPNVHPWCDGDRGPVTCVSEEETRKAKRGVEDAKKNIQDLKDKKSKAESNRSSATTDDEKKKYNDEITQIEKDLYDAGKKLEQAEKDLEARKKLVEDAIYNLDKCISYRRAVMNSFAAALDKVRNENEPPEIRDVARSLRNKYEKAKSGHEEQITAKTNASNNCKSWRP
jgi:vacuolar-type H+-ATPase subunit I/STV1